MISSRPHRAPCYSPRSRRANRSRRRWVDPSDPAEGPALAAGYRRLLESLPPAAAMLPLKDFAEALCDIAAVWAGCWPASTKAGRKRRAPPAPSPASLLLLADDEQSLLLPAAAASGRPAAWSATITWPDSSISSALNLPDGEVAAEGRDADVGWSFAATGGDTCEAHGAEHGAVGGSSSALPGFYLGAPSNVGPGNLCPCGCSCSRSGGGGGGSDGGSAVQFDCTIAAVMDTYGGDRGCRLDGLLRQASLGGGGSWGGVMSGCQTAPKLPWMSEGVELEQAGSVAGVGQDWHHWMDSGEGWPGWVDPDSTA